MMKKLTAVSVVLILMLVLFTSCDKNKKDSSKKDSTKSESTKDSSEGTDYKVKADPDVLDDSGTMYVYDCSYLGLAALTDKANVKETVKFESEQGKKIRDGMDAILWEDEGYFYDYYLNTSWYDIKLQFTGCENNYYIDFANDRVFDFVTDVSDGSDEWDGYTVRMGNMTKALIDSINELCPERTEGYEFDENGHMTEKSVGEYAEKVTFNYLKFLEDRYFSDNPEDYRVTLKASNSVDYDVTIEWKNNWYTFCVASVDSVDVGINEFSILSGRPGFVQGEAKTGYGNGYGYYSYEGLYVNDHYYEEGYDPEKPRYDDEHFEYDEKNYLVSIASINGYKPEPVEDIVRDAREYIENVFPGFAGSTEQWVTEENDDGKTVKYILDGVYGCPIVLASFVYDAENRLTSASMQMELLMDIKEEEVDELVKYDEVVEKAKDEFKTLHPEIEDYETEAEPVIYYGIRWKVRFICPEINYYGLYDALTGERILLRKEK